MSIFYYIEIETECSLEQCKEILLDDIQHEVVPTIPTELTVRTPYFALSLEKLDNDEKGFSYEFGLRATIQITIYGIRRSNENTMPMMYRLFMRWVHYSDDTAVLLFEGEIIYFLSKGGQLIRNSDKNYWRSDLDKIIDKEYTQQVFPIL